MAVCPAKTQISLGIRPVWSVFAVRMKKAWVLSYPLSAQRRLWSDWADAQADLSLRWAHTHFVGLSCRGSFMLVIVWVLHACRPLSILSMHAANMRFNTLFCHIKHNKSRINGPCWKYFFLKKKKKKRKKEKERKNITTLLKSFIWNREKTLLLWFIIIIVKCLSVLSLTHCSIYLG